MVAHRLPILFLSVSVLACGDARVLTQDPQPEPEAAEQDACPVWLLIERAGDAPRYERRVYDLQGRVVRRESGGAARSTTGEHHSVTEINYEDGLVTLESEHRGTLEEESVHAFTEVTELDDAGRPRRILGWDTPEQPAPNRTVSQEYDGEGRLRIRHQQDSYANGGSVDRRCSYSYDGAGRLDAKVCAGTNPDSRHYGWDDDGNLLFSELVTDTFTSRSEYTYDGSLLSTALWDGFSLDEFDYDGAGQLVWHRNERFDGLGGSLDEYEYDDDGRVAQHLSMDLDGSRRDTTSFRYDTNGRLVEAASELSPRSYEYEQSDDELTVTERWGEDVFEVRRYRCAPTPPTGLPLETNPEPFGGQDRVLPHRTAEPLPYPEQR